MGLLYTLIGICLVYAFFAIVSARFKAKAMERIEQEQEEQREAIEESKQAIIVQQETASEIARRQVEIIREQVRQAKAQERLAAEQARQAEILAKHEEEIAKLQYSVAKAESDIDFFNDRIANLDTILDGLKRQQAKATPNSKDAVALQKKIIVLENQVHTAETKLLKAQFDKEQAQRKLSA